MVLLTHCWRDKGVHAFLEGISSKWVLIAQFYFKLISYEEMQTRVAVSIFYVDNHYTTGTAYIIFLSLLAFWNC